ncbi:MAG: hypothetical protein LBJ74_01230 [Heliobacteriaceae bacterium]|jgi:hypothetical protein|nr:hypothetical protein [Heliobacteriaceae bacterium]
MNLKKIPPYVNAAYSGYTGKKSYRFPILLNLPPKRYPDVTTQYENFLNQAKDEITLLKNKPFGFFRVLNIFLKKFPTAMSWDTKFLPQFPGRNQAGKTQYALLYDEKVTGNHVSNYFYGQLCIHAGFPKFFAKLCAKMDASGITELFTKKKFPSWKLLKNRDTRADQISINRAYKDATSAPAH